MIATNSALETPRTAPSLAPLFAGHRIFGAAPMFRDRPIQVLFDITDECGDVARIRVPLIGHTSQIMIRHPDHLRHVLIDNAKNYGKKTRPYDKLRRLLGSGLIMSEGDFWKRQRRIANPAFHRQRIAHFADVMVACARSMLDGWDAHVASGRRFDVASDLMRVTLRVIGLTMLSTDVEARSSVISKAHDEILHITIRRMQKLWVMPEWFPTLENRRYERALATLDGVVNAVIADRRRTHEEKNDLLSMLMSARDPETGECMSDKQLRDEVMTVFLAGHETTANTLAWTLYFLSLHPPAQRALEGEVRDVLGGRPPRLEDLENLIHTYQVIKESMRLRPPIWLISRSAIEEDVIGGYRIPKGSWIFASPYLTHHDGRFWPNPEGFDPERFSPEREAARPICAYLPFLVGPRKCIGDTFAMMEARLILACIAQRFRLDLAPSFPVEIDPTVTLRPKGGLWMTAHSQPHGAILSQGHGATPGAAATPSRDRIPE